jgi:hypothetical protein
LRYDRLCGILEGFVLKYPLIRLLSIACVSASMSAFLGCDRGSEGSAAVVPPPLTPVPASFDDGTPRQRSEFEAIAARMNLRGNPQLFTKVRLASIRKGLNEPNLPLAKRLELAAALAQALMEDGDIDGALRELAAVDEMGKLLPGGLEKYANLHWLRGLIYLRQA